MKVREILSRKWLVVIILFGIIILLATATVNIIVNALKNVTLVVFIAPEEAVVSIDGKEYHNGIYRLFPSTETEAEISAPGFQAKTISIDLSADSIVTVQDYLLSSENGFKYYRDNMEDYNILKLVAKDDEALEFIEKVERVIGILDYLPIEESVRLNGSDDWVYSVTIRDTSDNDDCEEIVCLGAYTDADDREIIQQVLKEKGFDINSYQITYNFLKHPDAQ